MYETILVATDGSTDANRAVTHALEQAEQHGSERHGNPSVEIINYADDIDAGLIVLGYHGHSHQTTDNIGSVTDRVVQNAGRPVLVAT
jgi:nucleotide-binding universal stress UspA family protein